MSNDSSGLSPPPTEPPNPEASMSKKKSLSIDTNLEDDASNRLDEIGYGIEKLNVDGGKTSEDPDKVRNRQMQTPPPIETDKIQPEEVGSKTPPAISIDLGVQEADLNTPKADEINHPLSFKRTLSSPPILDDSLPPRQPYSGKYSFLSPIPQSPAANALHHSTLTPITRNTYFGELEDDEDPDYVVVSPEDNIDDYLPSLVMPGSNEINNDDSSKPQLSFTMQHPSLNSLPDAIFLSAENYENPTGSPPITPQFRHTTGSSKISLSLPRPSPRSRSLSTAEITSMSRTHQPLEVPSSPQDSEDSHSAYFNNVSAPSEFFEHLAFNDPLMESHHSYFSSSSSQISRLRRGVSLNAAIQELPSTLTNSNDINKGSTHQYQPSRRDDSLTDIGISKNTEGFDDIFTTRSPTKHNSSPLKRPIALDERQLSIPSLRLANRLGNDSTASFTDGEYSWEDEDDIRIIYGSEDEENIFSPDSDGQEIFQKTSVLILPDHLTDQSDSELISNVAVGSTNADSFLRRDDSISSISDAPLDKESKKVVVEVSENLSGKVRKSSPRKYKRRNSDPLEWIHTLQCGSENKVGEAASSKFLTKGVTPKAHVTFVDSSLRGGNSSRSLKELIMSQSADRGAMRRGFAIEDP